MWSSGLEGNLDVVGMEKAFCRTAKQSIYLGVQSKDPFIRGMLGIVSERLLFFLVLIPLSGVY